MGVSDCGKNTKFYLRLPEKIVDEQQVKALHPEIVKVILPRQKSRRWCFVELGGEVKRVVEELKRVEVGGKRVCVRGLKKRE